MPDETGDFLIVIYKLQNKFYWILQLVLENEYQ